jgi:peptide deformylase
METLEIKTFGEQCLREKSRPVEEKNENLSSLLEEMALLMKKRRGVGLAAPQVGINRRIILFDAGGAVCEVINPEISLGEGSECSTEGCLSVPGAEVEVERAKKILLEGLDRNLTPVKYSFEGLPARIVQHEIDHLDGILIIDYLSLVKRKVFDRKWKKNSG